MNDLNGHAATNPKIRRVLNPVYNTFTASSSTACSTPPMRAGLSSTPPPGSMSQPSPMCRRACAGGCLLRVFVRRGLLPGDDAQAMAQWQHGGSFSVDGSVRIEAADRAGRERLLR
ncbi:MAG: hypothetical protein WCP26_16085, partial [Actinomycetes bacterium]